MGDVRLGRAVAGFAGDAQFRCLGVDGARAGIDAGPAGDGVALDADVVPLGIGRGQVRVAQEGVLYRHPFLIGDQPAEGEGVLQVAVGVGGPVHLQVVGTGGHGHALRVGLDAVGADGVHPELVALLLELQRRLAKRQPGAVPLGQDSLRLGQLRHRAVIAVVPAFVLGRVAGAAGLRGGVGVVRRGDRLKPGLRRRGGSQRGAGSVVA